MSSYLKTLILGLIAIFAPAQSVVITVLVLCIADLISGVAAAVKEGSPITSSGLKTTVIKVMLYETATLLAFLVGSYLVPEELPVMKIVTGLIGMTELKSVLENLDRISGDKFFRSVVSKLQSMGKTDEDDSKNP